MRAPHPVAQLSSSALCLAKLGVLDVPTMTALETELASRLPSLMQRLPPSATDHTAQTKGLSQLICAVGRVTEPASLDVDAVVNEVRKCVRAVE
jgi:hypothetical protein